MPTDPQAPRASLLTKTSDEITSAANRLAHAAASMTPCAPVRDLIGLDDIQAAYWVQEKFNQINKGGTPVVGRKIGATSKAVQNQLNVDQPDFGVLYADMRYMSGDSVPMDTLLQPRVEAEIAFVLSQDLADGPLDQDQCRDAIDYAVPALEIVDSRITGWDISFADTVADNASSGLFVVGGERLTLADFEPREVVMEVRVGQEVVSSGNGTATLGDPLNALMWLARQAQAFGEPLRAGQLILSGALGPLHPISTGDVVTASLQPLGRVTATFVSSTQ